MVSLVRLTQPKGTEQKEDDIMNQLFTDMYAKEHEIHTRYHAAKEAHDQQAMQQAHDDLAALRGEIFDMGEKFRTMYNLYATAMKVGNAQIDIWEPSQYRKADELIADFREYGIETFTFSSSWSSASATAWKFIENGCKLEGMIEIRGNTIDYWTDEYEKRPAYLFRV